MDPTASTFNHNPPLGSATEQRAGLISNIRIFCWKYISTFKIICVSLAKERFLFIRILYNSKKALANTIPYSLSLTLFREQKIQTAEIRAQRDARLKHLLYMLKQSHIGNPDDIQQLTLLLNTPKSNTKEIDAKIERLMNLYCTSSKALSTKTSGFVAKIIKSYSQYIKKLSLLINTHTKSLTDIQMIARAKQQKIKTIENNTLKEMGATNIIFFNRILQEKDFNYAISDHVSLVEHQKSIYKQQRLEHDIRIAHFTWSKLVNQCALEISESVVEQVKRKEEICVLDAAINKTRQQQQICSMREVVLDFSCQRVKYYHKAILWRRLLTEYDKMYKVFANVRNTSPSESLIYSESLIDDDHKLLKRDVDKLFQSCFKERGKQIISHASMILLEYGNALNRSNNDYIVEGPSTVLPREGGLYKLLVDIEDRTKVLQEKARKVFVSKLQKKLRKDKEYLIVHIPQTTLKNY